MVFESYVYHMIAKQIDANHFLTSKGGILYDARCQVNECRSVVRKTKIASERAKCILVRVNLRPREDI